MKPPTIFMVLFVLSRRIHHSLESPVGEALRSDIDVGAIRQRVSRSTKTVAEAALSQLLSGGENRLVHEDRHRQSDDDDDDDVINEMQPPRSMLTASDVDGEPKRAWDDESVISWIKREVQSGKHPTLRQDLKSDSEYDPMAISRMDLRASETAFSDEEKRKWDEGDMTWIKRAKSRRPGGKMAAQYAASGHRGKRLVMY